MAASRAPLDALAPGSRLAVLRALPGLGDFLCVVPALRAIKRTRPDLDVTLIGLPETEALADRFAAYVDRFVPFPGFPGLPERRPDVRRLPGFLTEMHEARLELAIQLHGSGELTNPIACLLGARHVAGHYRESPPAADATRFLPWRDDVSEVRRGLRLAAHLGWPSDDERLEFPVDPAGDTELDAIDATADGAPLDRAALQRPFAAIHPGASTPARRWAPTAFAEVADGLHAAGLPVVLTGSAAERPVTAAVAASMRAPAVDLAGRTTLDGLAALLRRSSLLVANDTGVAHLADALRVPSVVVFRDSSEARWGPLDRRLHRVSRGPARHVLAEARRLLAGRVRDAA